MSAADEAEALRVLLVDDDELDRMIVARALRGHGGPIAIVEADSAEAAHAAIVAGSFDCIFSDLHMPGRDGAWLLQQIRGRGVDTPFVALTGHGDEQTAVGMMKAGAADYVVKGGPGTGRLAQVLGHVVRVHRAERETRQAEQALRRSEERLRLALEVTGLGTWDVDVLADRFECDERCRVLLGLPRDAVHAMNAGYLAIHPEAREAALVALQRALDPTGDGRYDCEYRVADGEDGQPRWLRGAGQAYFQDGRATRLVGTVLDVTARKRAEEVARRRGEFEQQLIGIVSHDLRNPISAMIMGAAVLAQRLAANSPLASVAGRILSSGDRAVRLIRDLLHFTQARSSSGIPIQRPAARVHGVCHQTVEEVALNHPDRSVVHEAGGDGAGLWDPDRLAQVVGNLAINAVTYSPPGTRVMGRSRGLADRVVIEVHNLGAAIPAAVLPTLFTPFQRRERRQDPDRSIGLGLFIVKEIVVAHGGAVHVRSTPADGTRFTVELPRGAAGEADGGDPEHG